MTLLSDLVSRAFLDEIAPRRGRAGVTPDLLAWTERYRSIGGARLLPSRIPWLRDLYRWDAPEIRVMKASQVFISEWMVNTALWACDTALGDRGNALYVFPTAREAADFSQARVDSAINESSYLAERTGLVYEDRSGRRGRRRSAARVTLKRVGRGHLYLRGGDRRRQLLTVDADALLCDEVDEYRRGTIDLARQRLGSATAPLVRVASTPKFPSSGIAPLWAETTRHRYHLTCRACGLSQPLEFPENLNREGHLVCRDCAGLLNPTAEGRWVADYPEAEVIGVHVSRLYSPRADLVALAELGYDILDHLVTDPETVQEWHNQVLGLPHAPAGGALTDDILDHCRADYGLPAPVTAPPAVMGVDVGGVCHWWVKAPVPDQDQYPGATRLLAYGTAPNEDAEDGEPWPEIGRMMALYKVRLAVVDALPEDERSARFCARWGGRAYRCFYQDETNWRYEAASAWNPKERIVHANRTRAIDACFQRFHHALEALPRDAQHHPTLYAHLKAPVRVLTTDARGRTVARYQEGLAPDHLAHAAVYAELARVFCAHPDAPVTERPAKPRPLKVRG